MMGLWSTIFSGSTADKAVDAVIATGDKLVYTAEEQAEMKLKTADMHIKMLGAYAPFKLAQRVLAFMLVGTFLLGHFLAISFYIYGAVGESVTIAQLAKDLFTINNDTLGIPVATIIGFYFLGGTIESARAK